MPRSRTDSKLSDGLTGTAGEYLVAGELSRRGFIAALTLRNSQGVDILVSDEDARRYVGVQVKTSRGDKPVWILSKKIERMETAENLVFVFVVLNGLGQPAFHIVPRGELIAEVTEKHRAWLNAPGRKGQARRDSSIRKFEDRDGKYLDRWDLLGLA